MHNEKAGGIPSAFFVIAVFLADSLQFEWTREVTVGVPKGTWCRDCYSVLCGLFQCTRSLPEGGDPSGHTVMIVAVTNDYEYFRNQSLLSPYGIPLDRFGHQKIIGL